MVTTLEQAINATATTYNGAVTNHSSLNKCVDLFYLAGASRNKDITSVFAGAFGEDPNTAVRILQWVRDARGGAGERDTFRSLFSFLIMADLKFAARILVKIPEIGRWDDLLVAFGTPLENQALRMIAVALHDEMNGLAAKWMPRKGPAANKLRAYMKMTPKGYRVLLKELSNTVEQKMCARDWKTISYSQVPSLAAARYQKAFSRNDAVRYADYRDKLATGEEKINASVAFPYEVIRGMHNGDKGVAEAQWKALPNYAEGSTERVLSVVDVSGSMYQRVSGSVMAVDVAVSLGLYISERMEGPFKDTFITFSETPELQKVSGGLFSRYSQMNDADWGYNTNIQAVFELILNAAKNSNVSESQMPTKLLILSDMEFDIAIKDGRSVSIFDMMRHRYEKAGYKLPEIVFWNLVGRVGNVPVTHDTQGTSLVSGFSPSILKTVLSGKPLDPVSTMFETVYVERYDY